MDAVQDDGTATMRPIKVQKQDETQTVVESGVTPNERVITTGFARLTDGAKVSISSGDGTPAVRAPGPRQGGPRQSGEGGQRRGGSNARPNAGQ